MNQHVRTTLRRKSNKRDCFVPVVGHSEFLLRPFEDGPLVFRPQRPVLDAVDELVEQEFRGSTLVRPQRIQKGFRHLVYEEQKLIYGRTICDSTKLDHT